MCRYPNPLQKLGAPRPGDRIMVQKYIYNFIQPERWDVVVFNAPHQPETNYIKRLVGLPDEKLAILDGNIYVKPDGTASTGNGGSGADGADRENGGDEATDDAESTQAMAGGSNGWRIARKTDRPEVQRAVFKPIYHSQYVPLDLGESQVVRSESGQRRRTRPAPALHWAQPWTPAQPQNWQIEDRRGYRFDGPGSEGGTVNSDEGDYEGSGGTLRFDFSRGHYHTRASMHPYNQFKSNGEPEPIEDIRLAVTTNLSGADFGGDSGTDSEGSGGSGGSGGAKLQLETTARLRHPNAPGARQTLTATVTADGARLTATHPDTGKSRTLAERSFTTALAPGEMDGPVEVELWYVDQEAMLWIAGEPVLSHRYNLSLRELVDRPPPSGTPDLAVRVNQPATLHRIELGRDLHYTSGAGTMQPGRGTLRRSNGRVTGKPFTIGPDQFFCLGDNSPASQDSRLWNIGPGEPAVDPWIRETIPASRNPGVVPRKLMVGRAFFVYWPAPYGFTKSRSGIPLLPNFGDMRFIE
jgi:signal peptidase I